MRSLSNFNLPACLVVLAITLGMAGGSPFVNEEGVEQTAEELTDEPITEEEATEGEEEYAGPDFSDERTVEDELLRRDFPEPVKPRHKPPATPPTPEDYEVPRTRE